MVHFSISLPSDGKQSFPTEHDWRRFPSTDLTPEKLRFPQSMIGDGFPSTDLPLPLPLPLPLVPGF
jgi:hypothetical protein